MKDLPKTRKEALETGAKYFFTGKPCRHGHTSKRYVSGGCVTCYRAYSNARYAADPDTHCKASRAYNAANKERIIAKRKEYYAKDKERIKAKSRAYGAANKERVSAYSKEYYANWDPALRKAYREANKERDRVWGQEWRKKNPDRVKAFAHRRRAAELNASPPWHDTPRLRAIVKASTEPGMHLDHILPLLAPWIKIGRKKVRHVSGLHVAANLQPLPGDANSSKGNSFDPTQASIDQMRLLKRKGLAAKGRCIAHANGCIVGYGTDT